MIRSPIRLLAVLAAAVALSAPAAAQPKHQWKFVSIIPAGEAVYIDRFKELTAEIGKRTNGQVEVSFFPAGELPYKGQEYLRVTGKGMVEMSEVVTAYSFGDAPALLLGDLPFLALNAAERKTVQGIVEPYMTAALDKQGVVPIANGAYPSRNIVTRNPVKSMEGLKGLKIRTSGGLEAEYVKLWGASPSFVVWAELYPATQRGVVDGLLTSSLSIEAAKLYEVAPYFLKIDGPVANFAITVNKAAWDKLTPELQTQVKAVGDWWTDRWQTMVVEEGDKGAIKRMQDKGQIKGVVQAPASMQVETRKRLVPLYRSFVKEKVGPEGSATLEKVLTALNIQ